MFHTRGVIKLDLFLSVLSETTDSTEEEWQSIADLATACRSILEALSREGEELFIHAHLAYCIYKCKIIRRAVLVVSAVTNIQRNLDLILPVFISS